MIESERLNIRIWEKRDIDPMSKISGDTEVMKYFPSTQNKEIVKKFVLKQIEQFKNRNHCYFAVELKQSKDFIGFVGLSYIDFAADFTPCIDIGWRIDKKHWGRGYATEAAKSCLEFAWSVLKLDKIYAVAPVINTPSINIMKKLNMQFQYDFTHPFLVDYPNLKRCSLYKIENPK